MTHKHSDYMHWSKTESRARFNLATSGVAPFPLRELPVRLETLEINGYNESGYGYGPLQKVIAAHHGVDPDCVVESAGTSMANHLAMAPILEPGDEVLIEHPAYGPILDVAQYLHANVKRFLRTRETGWVVDPGKILRAITPKTRLIVITNLHNPTSVLTADSTLREIGEIAARVILPVLQEKLAQLLAVASLHDRLLAVIIHLELRHVAQLECGQGGVEIGQHSFCWQYFFDD